MPARFDPLKLLSEIQADSATASASGSSSKDAHASNLTEEGEDDDFMSDKYLATTEPKQPLTYTDKRRRLEAHHSSRGGEKKSWREREAEAREDGLVRDLLAEAEIVAGGGKLPPEGRGGRRRWDLMEPQSSVGVALGESSAQGEEDGTTKAMRMMLAMGYRRGEALGRRMQSNPADQENVEEEEEDEDEEHGEVGSNIAAGVAPPADSDPEALDSDEEQALQRDRTDSNAREEDDYLTGGVSSAPFATTKLDNVSSRIEPLRPDQRWLGPDRRAGIGMLPSTPTSISQAIHSKASSSSQSSSTTEADFRTRIAHTHAQRHTANLLSRARTTLHHLDQNLNLGYSPLWLDADVYHLLSGHTYSATANTGTIDERMQTDPAFKEAVELLQRVFASEDAEQRREAESFCNLDAGAQLELVLARLREGHNYCPFCGCQYASTQELATHCPGETEDVHD